MGSGGLFGFIDSGGLFGSIKPGGEVGISIEGRCGRASVVPGAVSGRPRYAIIKARGCCCAIAINSVAVAFEIEMGFSVSNETRWVRS